MIFFPAYCVCLFERVTAFSLRKALATQRQSAAQSKKIFMLHHFICPAAAFSRGAQSALPFFKNKGHSLRVYCKF